MMNVLRMWEWIVKDKYMMYFYVYRNCLSLVGVKILFLEWGIWIYVLNCGGCDGL